MKDRAGLRSVCVDCAHPAPLARFWAAALGWTVRPYSDEDVAELASEGLTPETDPSVCVDPPDPSFPTLWFNRVPEPKVGKVRIHLDVNLDAADGIERLVGLGASILQERPGGNEWTIMSDPEGNEFCAFLVEAGAEAEPFGGASA
jgi:Glyoxalase-like domain